MKKSILITAALFMSACIHAQIIFSESFGSLALQSYTASSGTTQYTTIPAAFSLINDGHNNNVGASNNPNAPFHIAALKTTGWAVNYNSLENDTFLVSTSWFDTTTLAANRWVITPPITNIAANTILTWLAKSPDAGFADGYEVYGTNKTGTLTAADFTIGDRLLVVTAENAAWTRRSVNLGAFAGQTLRFAFRNNSTNKFQLWIDDIEVKTLALNLDGGITSVQSQKYILTNVNDTVRAHYTNNGATTINTVTLNYKYGTSSAVTQVFTFANGLSYGQNVECKFTFPYSFSSPGYYPLKVWAGSPNNATDQNSLNDTLTSYVTVQTTSPQKNVLVEQFVSAKDPETVDAQEKILALQSSSVIVVNIHDNDSLKEINSTGALTYRKNFSTAMVDRFYCDTLETNTFIRASYSKKINQRLKSVTPASVSIINKNFITGTKELTFTVKADFTGEVQGDYRINAYLVENHVYGNSADTSVNGYNQLSNYFNVPWSPYYQAGYFSTAENAYVLKAALYKHQRVLIHSFDGSFGNSGLIPQNGGTQNQSYQATFSITIPTATNGINKYNADNIYIVGYVAEFNTDQYKRNILNAAQEKLTANGEVVGITETVNPMNFQVYPNPTNGVIYLNGLNKGGTYEIKVYDLFGKCVFHKLTVNSFATEKLDLSRLSEGAYILNVSSGGKIYREKILKQGN